MGLITPLVERGIALASHAESLAWPPLLSTFRGAVVALLKNIQVGSLRITDIDGTLTVCGSPRREEPDGEKNVYTIPHTELKILNDLFWVRLLLFADMGFAESYMLGEIACPDLTAFFKLFILNRQYLSNGTTLTSKVNSNIAGLMRKTNTLANARLNTSAHKIRPSLIFEHDDGGKKMNEEDVEVFKRKWEYYFSYWEAGFATKTLGDVILTVGREGAVEMMEDVPL